ncbi:MAG: restriction endonuclease subunit S, partial [Candidatus Thorarchaeota archaeon]
IQNGGVYLSEADVEPCYLLTEGDFLISRSGTIGRAYVHNKQGGYSYAGYLVRFTFNSITTSKFVFYITKSEAFLRWLSSISIESTIGNVNGQKYANFQFGYPPEEEVKPIVNFLDKKTALIDELISKKRRQIELLKEQRQAVINQAVTKGLDPNVEMKESGIEWLGKIPKHWEVIKVKYLFSLVTEQAPSNNDYELLSLYTEIGVKPRKELEARGNKASTTDGYWMVSKGDIIVNKLLAWMGAVGYSEYDGVTSPAYDILRKNTDLESKFYHYLFRCGLYLTEFRRRSRGIMDMRLRLYFDELGQILAPYPPSSEQTQIVKHIDKINSETELTITKAEKQIQLLQEYRTALISEAVTGKIDVRQEG